MDINIKKCIKFRNSIGVKNGNNFYIFNDDRIHFEKMIVKGYVKKSLNKLDELALWRDCKKLQKKN